MSSNFLSSLALLICSTFAVCWLCVSPAFGSEEISDLSDQETMRVEFSQRSVSTSGTVTRRSAPSQTTQPRTNSPNSNFTSSPGTFSGSSRQSSTEQAPVLSSICYYGDPLYQSRRQGAYQCREPEPEEPAAEAAPAPGEPVGQAPVVVEPVEIVITSSDLLELIPASPQILMDRGPFGLKNAHTNFYASNHRPQTVTRTMFDQEVTITATPVEYHWVYGDGETLVTDVPGHPVEVFNTETETSHQYTDTGLYTVALTTVFEGTYQVDGGATQTVSSPVTQVADPVEIRIWRAVTRNVDQTCLQNPSAWGC